MIRHSLSVKYVQILIASRDYPHLMDMWIDELEALARKQISYVNSNCKH